MAFHMKRGSTQHLHEADTNNDKYYNWVGTDSIPCTRRTERPTWGRVAFLCFSGGQLSVVFPSFLVQVLIFVFGLFIFTLVATLGRFTSTTRERAITSKDKERWTASTTARKCVVFFIWTGQKRTKPSWAKEDVGHVLCAVRGQERAKRPDVGCVGGVSAFLVLGVFMASQQAPKHFSSLRSLLY